MSKTTPPTRPKSNRGVVLLLVGGVAILAVAGVILYRRSQPEPEPKPEPPVEQPVDVPAPLVVAQKQSPIETEDAGPEGPTAEDDTDTKKPRPKGGGAAEKPGTIDGKAVNRYINTRFGQVRTCYERRLKINPLLEGKVDLNIGINTRGKASSISVTKDTVRDPQMIDCIKGVIRSWEFPKPEGGKVVIAKQFTFKKKI